jgi:hypothetical protein
MMMQSCLLVSNVALKRLTNYLQNVGQPLRLAITKKSKAFTGLDIFHAVLIITKAENRVDGVDQL